MAGVKGRSGTNKGKDKIWADAIRVAVLRDGPDGKARIFALAEQCVTAALGGDMQAMKEIGDRLDGKPAQAIDMTAEVEHRYVARMPQKAQDTAEWQQQHTPTRQLQ
jgi:hypothetical protein